MPDEDHRDRPDPQVPHPPVPQSPPQPPPPSPGARVTASTRSAEAMVEAAGEHVREALAVHRCDERPTFEELPRSR